ncbi:DNA phosphorothioation-associated protein 4 [Moraxella bovoculi]|uniref:DNA phosphorothioation-associated protein 4 n=1 Tax=Moraxella bovoculi TaxID=386891 RepID=UPI0009B95A7F|nr:DNA phosphorothioation-associated protein 4 [Moraxella bovoculi]AXR98923.1 DNA phosphorothioation-associated protein 4 [Moraxella bovoculi]
MKASTVNENWRNIQINRDRKHENLVHHLVENPNTAIFNFNKDLMVFAAMLGYHYGIKRPLSSDTIQIVLQTYHSTEDDGYIYLLALLENKNATCLKNENLIESKKIFEEYCNGGLELLQDWFDSNPADVEKVDTLQQKVEEHIRQNLILNQQNETADFGEIDF